LGSLPRGGEVNSSKPGPDGGEEKQEVCPSHVGRKPSLSILDPEARQEVKRPRTLR